MALILYLPNTELPNLHFTVITNFVLEILALNILHLPVLISISVLVIEAVKQRFTQRIVSCTA